MPEDRDDAAPTDELMFDWDRLLGEALDWERHERRFAQNWERDFPHGPAWEQVMDYHRYGYVAHHLYPDEPRDAILERIQTGYERGEWDTSDPWPMIEAALRQGWKEAAGTE